MFAVNIRVYVGELVGNKVGEDEGIIVGILLGTKVGNIDGPDVGIKVGDIDEIIVKLLTHDPYDMT
jgi:hypothetical protein